MTVVTTRDDNQTVRLVDRLTIDEVRLYNMSRAYIGTLTGPRRSKKYEFEVYVGREDVFLVSRLWNAPDEGAFPEGQVYVRTSIKELSVGATFTVQQTEAFLSQTDFVVAYIHVPYIGS